ncbi:PP2C-like domain-containing protein CG9801 [Scaptodrosophila lebanonensis]|uniref:PP2C-like domain-containing protein CG9801 n=1 Tax=Drosophila lebanonensis TaxID=7225 RepID=A0A6J2T9U1_DROLE|nr:PP2C-like domain-containing protein CG9801 [Scaptodrosophila lebanonensis]XP_030373615.1 PP2C-like domain-containing protein CG9801 [Scaptodrosophila lebanonensis]XP_030373616.1 PP2C-like domain-containing protein CG9801 [Scaptodrosophila lebanonensis]XP_030373617.1 PP2C-like domain-containing protein CG9801 [Scaptodrosophila lebanonensis]
MPSLRQKVTTYFRQLSFIAEPREGSARSGRHRVTADEDDEGNFIIKYLEGRMERQFVPGPEIYNGQSPTEMPVLKLGRYAGGTSAITAACTGPDEGLTGIKRSKLHLSASYADDIDFIDTQQENDCYEVRKSTASTTNGNQSNQRLSNKFARTGSSRRQSNADQASGNAKGGSNAGVAGMRSRKNSKTGIANLVGGSKEQEANKATTIVVSMVSSSRSPAPLRASNDQNNKNVMNGKTETTTSPDPASKDATAHELLENATERLLREAVSNQNGTPTAPAPPTLTDVVAGVHNWKMECESAYGISVSLYETNMLTKEPMGNPIADCYGMVVRGDAAAMAMADGVNWGDGARLAARSAVHGCLDYLDRAVFGQAQECMATTTQEVFVSLLRSLWEGHGCILEVGGALSTLTIAVVLPLDGDGGDRKKYVVCACNVGDSLGYVYSKQHGVREFTQASHDISSMRDMRDALGALGPADGNKPELSNLTFSMTFIERGDIVFLTSDGISDNFDPVVGKFAEAWTPDVKLQTTTALNGSSLAPKRQNKSASAIYARLHPSTPPTRPARHQPKSSSPPSNVPSRPKYMRSQTVIEPRRLSSAGAQATKPITAASSPPPIQRIPKSVSGLPLVTGPQRHALTLHRLEDLLSYGINGTFSPCVSARRLCHLLIDFVRMITSARRKTLEQRELFYKLATGADGVRREVELNRMQHRAARKRIVDSSAFSALPGKLDHATVLAYTVGSGQQATMNGNATSTEERDGGGGGGGGIAAPLLQSKEFKETNF